MPGPEHRGSGRLMRALPVLLLAWGLAAQAAPGVMRDAAGERGARIEGVDGRHYLVLEAGRAWVMDDVAIEAERLTFLLAPAGREPLTCGLQAVGMDRWRGDCATPDGGGALSLDVPLWTRAADPGPGRARDFGIAPGLFAPGAHNAITDVAGVRVGHRSLVSGRDVRTGVTAIVPAEGDLYRRPLPAAVHVANGYGKLTGISQIRELGELETPILLTCTLCVWTAANALAEASWVAENTVNPVVGETNDGWLNDQWARPLEEAHAREALASAATGPVVEGSVGAGTGTQAFGFKGGIGTSSRRLPDELGGWTLGVLVQTNFGGVLTMAGAPVGREIGAWPWRETLERAADPGPPPAKDDGSLMMVVATDAPLDPQALERLARRAILGAARTGSFVSNGSGDYVLAFSVHPEVRRERGVRAPVGAPRLLPGALSPLFAATVEATEEAIYNAILTATTVEGRGRALLPVPRAEVLESLRRHGLSAPDPAR